MNDEDKRIMSTNRKDNIKMFVICCLFVLVEIFILVKTDLNSYYVADFILFMAVGVVLGFYFTFIVKYRIPTFCDENKINFYSDGFTRINMSGLYFNNSNWSHISNYVRKWSDAIIVLTPIFFGIFDKIIPMQIAGFIYLFITLATLLIPIYMLGKNTYNKFKSGSS